MNKLLVALAFVGCAMAGLLSSIGNGAGKFNLGFCLAFQDNQNDTTTACYKSCNNTVPKI